jgi:hypothetical protein
MLGNAPAAMRRASLCCPFRAIKSKILRKDYGKTNIPLIYYSFAFQSEILHESFQSFTISHFPSASFALRKYVRYDIVFLILICYFLSVHRSTGCYNNHANNQRIETTPLQFLINLLTLVSRICENRLLVVLVLLNCSPNNQIVLESGTVSAKLRPKNTRKERRSRI